VARSQLIEQPINLALRYHHKKQGAQAPCFSLSEMQRFPLDGSMLLKTSRSIIIPVSVALAAGLALSSCGRKGDLDAPSTPVEQRNQRTNGKVETTPERPFILDKLL
jgi:predicted small lipoprotein YifL